MYQSRACGTQHETSVLWKSSFLWAHVKPPVYQVISQGRVCLHTWNMEHAVGWRFPSSGTVPAWSWCSQVSRGRVVFPVPFALCFRFMGYGIIILFPLPAQSPQSQQWLTPYGGIFDSPWREQSLPAQEVSSVPAQSSVSYLRYFWKGE